MLPIIDIVQAVTGPLKPPALQNAQSVIGSLEKYATTWDEYSAALIAAIPEDEE